MTTRRRALHLALGASAGSLIAGQTHALSGLFSAPANGIPTSAASVGGPSIQWWEDAKFGLFMHWGLYSVAAGDWKGRPAKGAEHFMLYERIPLKEYAELAKGLTLEYYDPDAWCRAAKHAGMRYLVITAKHHEGFAMFDSPSSSYNIVKMSPYGKDPMKPLAAACAKYGLKFCFYYSLGRDWEDPDVPTNWPVRAGRSNTWDYPDEDAKQISRYFERKVKPQVRELLTQYGPIGVMWFDTPELITPAESAELRALIHQLQPNCIVNSRIGNGQGDFEVVEQKLVRQGCLVEGADCTRPRHQHGIGKVPDARPPLFRAWPRRGQALLSEYFEGQIVPGRLARSDTNLMAQHYVSLLTGGPVRWITLGFQPPPLHSKELRKHLEAAIEVFLRGYSPTKN